MAVKLVTIYWSHYNSGISRTEVRGLLEVDTLSDLPTPDAITGYRLTIGCEADIIDTAARYKMDSSGLWHVQEQGTDFYTKSEIDTMMAGKADTATTLSGYGITDAYTKTETDNLLVAKADAANVYTKAQTNSRIQADVFGVGNNTYIADNSDMNSFTTAGIYIRQYSSGLSNFTNLPMNGSTYPYEPFKLVVEYLNSPNNIMQTILPTYSSFGYFRRIRIYGAGGTWQPWQYFAGTPV